MTIQKELSQTGSHVDLHETKYKQSRESRDLPTTKGYILIFAFFHLDLFYSSG